MRIQTFIVAALTLAGCSAETARHPDPAPRSEVADVDGDGEADQVDLVMDQDGWRLTLTFGGRPHDTRTIDRGGSPAQAPWDLRIARGGAYQPAPFDGATRLPVHPTEDVIIYTHSNSRRMLVWNSPDVGIERIAIR